MGAEDVGEGPMELKMVPTMQETVPESAKADERSVTWGDQRTAELAQGMVITMRGEMAEDAHMIATMLEEMDITEASSRAQVLKGRQWLTTEMKVQFGMPMEGQIAEIMRWTTRMRALSKRMMEMTLGGEEGHMAEIPAPGKEVGMEMETLIGM